MQLDSKSSLHDQICQELKRTAMQSKLPVPEQIRMSESQLRAFKTQMCDSIHRSDDSQALTAHHSMEYPYYFNCQKFHTEKDRRRVPLESNRILYDNKLVDGGYPQGCLNWVQFLYHPLNYKTQRCDNYKCTRRFCPRIHQGQEPFNNGHFVTGRQQEQENNQIQEIVGKLRSLKQISDHGKIDSCDDQNLLWEIANAELRINNYLNKLKMFEQQENNKMKEIHNEIRTLAQLSDKNSKCKEVSKQTKTENQSDKVKPKIQLLEYENYESLYYMEQLNIIEDRHHEFKMFKEKDPRRIAAMVLEYISAFLNTEGGFMYLGVNDESIVHGLEVNQNWIDQFQLNLDSDGRQHLSPPLIPQKYALRIIPVIHQKRTNLKVIQVVVFPQKEQVLTLYKRECYMRMTASNHRLTASDIMEYMRIVKGEARDPLSLSDDQIDAMSRSDLKELQQRVKKIDTKIMNTLRKRSQQIDSQNK